MVTCSFGINPYSTRCFNWISAGDYDEYVWIYNKGTSSALCKVESYKKIDSEVTPSGFRKEFPVEINNTIYARITSIFPADNTLFTAHKCIVDLGE
jgi:hypothetical protein